MTQSLAPRSKDDNDADAELVNSCAITLASFDKRACARAQITDANSLLEQLLLPMAFPWSHPNEHSLKVIPRDIDELPGILSIGDGLPEVEDHGKFRHLKGRGLPTNTQIASRRSHDPGVVELTTFFKPTKAQRHLAYSPRFYDPREEDQILHGELSLRMYQEVQARKRRRRDMETVNTTTRLVSFRLASTSSRSSIFEDFGTAKVPIFLHATLPRQVHEGTRKSGVVAFEVACDLGLYNCRPPPAVSTVLNDPSCINRFFVGRTRLIWTEKEEHGAQSQRAAFRSLLTGGRLEPNALKRPLNVKVAIFLNGTLLSSEKLPAFKCSEGFRAAHVSGILASKVVDDALDAACGKVPSSSEDYSQCSLNSEKLSSNIFGHLTLIPSRLSPDLVNRIREPFSVLRQILAGTSRGPSVQTLERACLNIIPPRIDCLPTEDGRISVMCSGSGRIVWERRPMESNQQASHSASTVILRELASESDRCLVCWSADSLIASVSSSVNCVICDIRVHAKCLASHQAHDEWTCPTCEQCSESSTSAERFCLVCNHAGGAFARVKDGWVHDVCRIWCEIDEYLPTCDVTKDTGVSTATCHICSEGSPLVVQCSAELCCVRFHPMCAVVASIGAEIHHKNLIRAGGKEGDAFLCTQYTLSLLHTSFADARKSVVGNSTTLPLAMCGYHNPKRQADWYGLYPGGCFLDGAMRIPPNRIYTKL